MERLRNRRPGLGREPRFHGDAPGPAQSSHPTDAIVFAYAGAERPGTKQASPDADLCGCELPGYFCSGVPGILAHIENGRLAAGAEVERCDQCQRYPSDEAARERLRELGFVQPEAPVV